MPRCPWLFPEKVNWKLDPQDASFESEVNENYPSADEFAQALREELEQQL